MLLLRVLRCDKCQSRSRSGMTLKERPEQAAILQEVSHDDLIMYLRRH